MSLPAGLDPRTPVLVGAAAVTQRHEGPDGHLELADALDAVGLMDQAAVRAAADATDGDGHGRSLLAQVGLVLVPKGIWDHRDPGRQVLAAHGARPHSVLAEVGVLQQTLLTRAIEAVAAGRADAALVLGGEDKERQRRATRAGLDPASLRPPTLATPEGAPDETWLPEGDILTRMEIERDLAVPAQQYALVEQALAHAEGRGAPEVAERLGRLWAAMAQVAAARPEAWDRSAPDARTIAVPGPANRMLTTPYTKLLVSQWNVDQAAALLVMSAEAADRAGVDHDRWVFPWVAAESDLMVPLPARAELHRSPAVAAVGAALAGSLGRPVAEAEVIDLYSCFPAAVGVQCRELGIDEGATLTVTGGMTFGGGPLNNYALMATAVLAERLRHQPGAIGLTTSISGMITKHGGSIWSTTPPPMRFAAHDVTEVARATTETRPLDPEATGPAQVVAATVIGDRGEPSRVVAVVETPDGSRTVAGNAAPDVVADWVTAESSRPAGTVGSAVTLTAPGSFVPD